MLRWQRRPGSGQEPTALLFDVVKPALAPHSIRVKLPVAALEPADIFNAILYLVGDADRYVTGITHVVDAGGRLG